MFDGNTEACGVLFRIYGAEFVGRGWEARVCWGLVSVDQCRHNVLLFLEVGHWKSTKLFRMEDKDPTKKGRDIFEGRFKAKAYHGRFQSSKRNGRLGLRTRVELTVREEKRKAKSKC